MVSQDLCGSLHGQLTLSLVDRVQIVLSILAIGDCSCVVRRPHVVLQIDYSSALPRKANKWGLCFGQIAISKAEQLYMLISMGSMCTKDDKCE